MWCENPYAKVTWKVRDWEVTSTSDETQDAIARNHFARPMKSSRPHSTVGAKIEDSVLNLGVYSTMKV